MFQTKDKCFNNDEKKIRNDRYLNIPIDLSPI